MLYKRLITGSVFGLLILVIAVGFWLIRVSKPQVPVLDFTNRIHTTLYQKATGFWDATLVSLREPTSSIIHVGWQKPTQIYNHFLITITDAKTGWTRTESGEHERITLDLSDLQSDVKYTIVLQACLDRACNAWLVSKEEFEQRTEKMIWQITEEIPDLDKLPEREEWETNVLLSEIRLLNEDAEEISSEEKINYTIERVTLVNGFYEQTMTLTQNFGEGTKTVVAKLMNP